MTLPPTTTASPAKVALLGNLDTLEVSLVGDGANGRPIAFAKAGPGEPVVPDSDVFAPASPLEANLLASLGGDALSPAGREAVLMAARCLSAVGPELNPLKALKVLTGLVSVVPVPSAPPPAPVAKSGDPEPTEKAAPMTPDPAMPPVDPAAAEKAAMPPASPPPVPSGTEPAAKAEPSPTPNPDAPPAPPAPPAGTEMAPLLPPIEDGEAMDAYAKRCGEAAMKAATAAYAAKQAAPTEKAAPTVGDVHVPGPMGAGEKEPAIEVEISKSAIESSPIAGVSKAVYAGLPAAVRKAHAEAVAKGIELERVAKAAEFKNTRRVFVAKAAKMPIPGNTAEATGELLHKLSLAAPELAPLVERSFAQASAAVSKGLLAEVGGSPAEAETTSDDPLAEVDALAREHVAKSLKDGVKVSIEKARGVVFKARPDLYSKYDDAHMRRSAKAEGIT